MRDGINWAVSDRVVVVKIRGKPFAINIQQVYAPTNEREEDEVEEFYDTSKLDEVADQCKNHEITVILGDTKAKVGKAVCRRETGELVHRKTKRGMNTRDEYLVLATSSTTVDMEITWRQERKNQIDHVTINRRYGNAVTKSEDTQEQIVTASTFRL